MNRGRKPLLSYFGLVGLIVFFVSLFLLFRYTEFKSFADLKRLASLGEALWAHPYGPISLILGISLGLILMLPVNLMTIAVAFFLPPIPAVVTTYLGTLIAAAIAYSLARVLGAQGVSQLVGSQVEKLKTHPLFARSGIMTMTLLRFIPIAPFTAFNLIAGALRIRFRDFFLGTCFGLIPGKVVVVLFADRIRTYSDAPTLGNMAAPLLIVGVFALFAIFLLKRRVKRSEDQV